MDWQLIQPIFHWLSDHPAWSGLFVFLIALTESLLIVGLIIPGTVLMFGVGTLVGTGVLDIKLVLFLAFLGAVLGDGISFWIGATYREQIENFWPFKKNPQILEKGKEFFTRHGGKSVFFGRFVGPVRPVIPAVAGMMHMPARKFFFINVISAAGWAPFYLIPGILFGTSIGLATAIGSRLVILLLSFFVIVVVCIFVVKKAMAYISPRLDIWFLSLLNWSNRYLFLRLTLGELIDPNKDAKSALLKISLVFFLFLITSSLFVFSVLTSWLAGIDSVLANVFGLIHVEANDTLMWLIQVAFSWPVIIFFLLSLFVNLYSNKCIKPLTHIFMLIMVSALSSWVLVYLYSVFVDADVHQLAFVQLTVLTTALFFYIVVSCENVKLNWHWLFYSVAALFVLFFAVSQMYFFILPFSSVVIALSLSFSWVLIFSLAYRRHHHEIHSFSFSSKSSFAVCAFAALLMIQGDYNRIELLSQKNNFQHSDDVNISRDDWLNELWIKENHYRVDIFGENKDRLNIQWLGSLEDIRREFLASGWSISNENTFQSVLYRLAPEPDLDKFIRLPRTHNGSIESLLLIKDHAENNRQLVFQLWPASFAVDNKPLWLGAISIQQLNPTNRWVTSFQVVNDKISDLLFYANFEKHWQVEIAEKSDAEYLLVFPKDVDTSNRHDENSEKTQKDLH